MNFLGKLVGLGLVLLGFYMVGQNIVFATRYTYGWWRDIPAASSVVLICSGVLTLLYGSEGFKSTGWILMAAGAAFAVFSGGVFLKPTSLWTFFVALMSMASGFQLLTTGRISL